jgi:hypothetical protein
MSDGSAKVRTIMVSSNKPTPIADPIWAIDSTLLPASANFVIPNTIPAVLTTPPVAANARMKLRSWPING